MKTAIECWKSAGNNPDNYSQSVNEAMEEYRLQSHPSQTNDSGIRKLLDKIILKVVDEEVYLYPSISSLELNKILSEYPHPTPVMSAEPSPQFSSGAIHSLGEFPATAPPANDGWVSGSFPGWVAELLTEIRLRLLINIDTDGNPRSSMTELLEMWDKVNKALDIKTIGVTPPPRNNNNLK